MTNPKEIQERKNVLATRIRELAEVTNKENRDFTPEEKENWEQINRDYSVAERQLETALRVDALDSEAEPAALIGRGDIPPTASRDEPSGSLRRIGPTYAQRDAAVEGWIRTEVGLEEPEDPIEARRLTDGMKACGVRPGSKGFDVPLLNTRELTTFRAGTQVRAAGQSTSATLGAELIPEGFVASVEKALQAVGALRQVATILRTAQGNDLPWPTVNDTAVSGRLLTEETAITQTNIVLSSVTFNAYKYSSDLVLVTPELLQDSAIDVPSLIGTLLGERLARIMNLHFTTGTGSSQPNGMITQAIVDNLNETASAGTLVGDDLIDLIHDVDPAYRNNASWLMHDNIFGNVRKLTVSDVGYLWQPSFVLGEPDRLLGWPIRINQDMDSDVAIVAGEEIAVFGDLSKYIIREVAGMRFRRLDERYADTDQVGFIAFMRADGDIPDRSGPIAVLRVKA